MPKKAEKKSGAAPAAPPLNLQGDLSERVEALFEDGVLVDISIGFWTALRRNTADDLGIEEEDVPGFVVGLGTKRLVPKSLSDTWTKVAAHARYIVRKHSFAFPISDTSFVPLKALPQVESELLRLKQQFEEARDHLLKNYDRVRAEMLKEYPKHRKALERLYPPRDVVISRFYFTWSAYTVSLPKRLRLTAHDKKKAAAEEAALQRYQRELEDRVARFLHDAVVTLRQKTAELAAGIAERIKSGEVVTNRSLNTLRNFVDRFKSMNFVGDREIEERLERLKAEILNGHDAESFTDDATLRDRLSTAVADLQKVASEVSDVNTVTGGYRRKIVL